MKLVHISDSHIGYSAFSKVDEATGLNLREVDFYEAFRRQIDRCLEIRPRVVLHSGDVFDSVRPTNRAISFALEQFLRLNEAGIDTVIISGNHSSPKLRETGSVFKIFEHLEHVHPVYKESYEIVDLGDLAVHALPHAEGEHLQKEAARMSPLQGKYNVAMMHVGISSLNVFRMNEFNEQILPASYLKPEFDYIALGHYHDFSQVTRNAYYAGSGERLSFAEAGSDKGLLEVELSPLKVRFRKMPTRPMVDLEPIDAKHMDLAQLRKELMRVLEAHELEGKIVRLRMTNLSQECYSSLDFHWLRQLAARAAHFEIKAELLPREAGAVAAYTGFASLDREWIAFLESYPLEKVDKSKVRAKGLEYLAKGVEESD
ncbi:MAG: exonuclease SbcCD subunit D [Methanomassiliicoccales archaeon]